MPYLASKNRAYYSSSAASSDDGDRQSCRLLHAQNPCNAGCRRLSHPGQLYEGRLDRAQPNDISHLRARDVTAVQRLLFVLPG